MFGYHVTGTAGTLFLSGIVVWAGGVAELRLLLAGARRTSRRGRQARRGLTQSRRETATVTQDRDDLLGQRETARAYTASTLGDGPAGGDRGPRPCSRPASVLPRAALQAADTVPAGESARLAKAGRTGEGGCGTPGPMRDVHRAAQRTRRGCLFPVARLRLCSYAAVSRFGRDIMALPAAAS